MFRLLEMISDSINDFYAVIQNIKFSTSLFLIGGNVTELHYQSVLVIYVSAEVRLHLHATVILSSNLSQNVRNPSPLFFLRIFQVSYILIQWQNYSMWYTIKFYFRILIIFMVHFRTFF